MRMFSATRSAFLLVIASLVARPAVAGDSIAMPLAISIEGDSKQLTDVRVVFDGWSIDSERPSPAAKGIAQDSIATVDVLSAAVYARNESAFVERSAAGSNPNGGPAQAYRFYSSILERGPLGHVEAVLGSCDQLLVVSSDHAGDGLVMGFVLQEGPSGELVQNLSAYFESAVAQVVSFAFQGGARLSPYTASDDGTAREIPLADAGCATTTVGKSMGAPPRLILPRVFRSLVDSDERAFLDAYRLSMARMVELVHRRIETGPNGEGAALSSATRTRLLERMGDTDEWVPHRCDRSRTRVMRVMDDVFVLFLVDQDDIWHAAYVRARPGMPMPELFNFRFRDPMSKLLTSATVIEAIVDEQTDAPPHAGETP